MRASIGPHRAALTKFHAYLTSDFTWVRLLHATCRIQMFHGVGGKYGFDAPTESLAPWHRLFFVNRRRLNNCIAAGALDADSPAIRLIGMPKVDALVDGSLNREPILASLGLPADRPTVLYAPTWSPASSLNKLGVALLHRLRMMPVNVIVKLHDRSRDLRPQYSGGVDWPAALQTHLAPGAAVLASAADICPYLAASDVMITDHSSAGFEYLLRDRPLVRIHVPELITLANIHQDYVRLLSRRVRVDHAGRRHVGCGRARARGPGSEVGHAPGGRRGFVPRARNGNGTMRRRALRGDRARADFAAWRLRTRFGAGAWSPALRRCSLPA